MNQVVSLDLSDQIPGSIKACSVNAESDFHAICIEKATNGVRLHILDDAGMVWLEGYDANQDAMAIIELPCALARRLAKAILEISEG